MALNSRSSIDPRWVYHNRRVGYGLQVAQISLYHPDTDTKTYNATTNTWTGTSTPVWSGNARIQSIGNANSTNIADSTYNPTTVQSVRFQIPFPVGADLVDIRPNDKVIITNSPYDATLTKFVYIVTNIINSSNPWERTFMCRVDTEIDPNVTS